MPQRNPGIMVLIVPCGGTDFLKSKNHELFILGVYDDEWMRPYDLVKLLYSRFRSNMNEQIGVAVAWNRMKVMTFLHPSTRLFIS